MSSPRRIVAITALVGILLVGLASSAPDMFTALVDMQRALCDEQTAATLLRQYTANQKQLLQQLDRLADEWEEHSRSGLEDVERHMFNPVNYFLIAKRFTIDWNQKLAQYFPIDINQQFLSTLAESTFNFPNYDNYIMSASALLRLQDTYALETASIASGHVGSSASISPSMSAEDCFQLGKVAYDNGDYYHAIKWFDEAVRLDIAINSTVPRSLLLDYLSFSVFQQGNVRHAFNLTLAWLQLEPGHERALSNLNHYTEMILQEERELERARQVVIRDPELRNDRPLDGVRASPDFLDYERLCRGEQVFRPISDAERTQLVCRYRRHIPIFYIRPLKEELLNVDPKVVIYHDVITESEIAMIKQLATPVLHRSGVFALRGADNPQTPGYTSYRTSKSAWLGDHYDPLIARVSRRAAGLSNLTLDSAEEMQVLNYGIGGHYEPHYDFARQDEETAFGDYQGNRLATAIYYLNDIEAGGYTVFNLLGISQPATKGSCLLWYNLMLSGEGDFRTRHAGCPVLVGTKWVANKWFHTGGQEFVRRCSVNPAM